MSNWAIVIGIDKYWTDSANLRGAVRDALAMREWLVDPAGGGVPPGNPAPLLRRPAGEPGARPRARPGEPSGRRGAERTWGDEVEHHRRDQQPDRPERRRR